MSGTLVLLPDEERWLRIDDNRITSRGDSFTDLSADPADDERVIAILPSRLAIVHHGALAGLSDAQARAAARLLVAGQSPARPDDLHVAVGDEVDGERPIVAVDRAELRGLLAKLSALGFDPDRVLAEPLLLPRPAEGFVRGRPGDTAIVRGRDAAFADDPVLAPLVIGDDRLVDLDGAETEAALVAAVAAPEVDLRQGDFAPVRRWSIDWPLLRRIGVLAASLAGVTLILTLAMIAKLDLTSSRIEAANAQAARAVLPSGTTAGNPVAQLDERLAALRGAGGGFLPLAAAITSAVNATANTELGALVYDPAGAVRATVRGSSPAELVAVEQRLVADGLVVTAGAITTDATRPARELTVRAR